MATPPASPALAAEPAARRASWTGWFSIFSRGSSLPSAGSATNLASLTPPSPASTSPRPHAATFAPQPSGLQSSASAPSAVMPPKVPIPETATVEMGEIFLSVYKFYDEKTISAGLEDLLEVSESDVAAEALRISETYAILRTLLYTKQVESELLFRTLTKLADSPKRVGDMSIITPTVLGYLREDAGSSEAERQMACRLLRRLLHHRNNKNAFMAAEGLQLFDALLARSPDDAKERITFLLGVMVANTSDAGKAALLDAMERQGDLLARIVHALSSDNPLLVRAAAGFIWSVASLPPDKRMGLVKLGVIPPLVACLKHENQDVLWQASGALRNLAIGSADLATAIVCQHRVLDALAPVLERASTLRPEVLSAVLGFLFGITFFKKDDLHAALLSCELLLPLFVSTILSPTASDEAVIVSLGSLRNIAHLYPDEQAAIRKAHGIDVCFQMLNHNNPLVRENAISAIWALTLDNPENQRYVGESGVLSALVGLFTAGAADSTVCNLLAAIKNLTHNNESAREYMRKQAVMPIVVRQLSSPHPSVQDYAASALAALCGDNADALQQAIDEGCLPPLVRMLMSQNRGILISAYCTLAVLVPINPEAAVKAMLEAQVLPALTRALSDPLPAIRLHSTAMLRYLLCEGRARNATREIGVALARNLAQENDQELLRETLSTLSVAAEFNDAVQDAVRDEGGFLVVVKSVGKANRRIQHFALMSVYSLAKAHPKNQALFIEMQILPRVIALLLSDQIDVSKVAARTIGALVEDLSLIWTYTTTQDIVLQFPGTMAALVRLLQAQDPVANEYAASCLYSLTSNKNARAQDALRENGALLPLVELLRVPDVRDSFIFYVVAAIDAASAGNVANREVLRVGGVTELLERLQTSDSEFIRAKVASALGYLRS